MATEVIHVIDPDQGTGHDYHSLSDWEAGEQGDLTGVRDEIAVAKCRCTGGTADNTWVIVDGWTTDATRYIKIWTDPAESYRHNGTWQTGNKYRLVVAEGGGAIIHVQEQYTKVIGLQLDSGGTDLTTYGIETDGGTAGDYSIVSHCIIKRITYGGGGAAICCNYTSYAKIYNNIVYDADYGIRINGNFCGSTVIYNNTISGCTTGIARDEDNVGGNLTINNICSGCTAAAAGIHSAGSGYNATNNASMGYTVTGGATGDRVSQTFTFVGASDYHLASNDAGALGHGLNLYDDAVLPFQDDIDGQDRGGAAAAWDIGADEYVSTATLIQEGFRFRNDDGSETAATWNADQDATITLTANTPKRLRIVVDTTGDPESKNLQLEYRMKPSGGSFGAWNKV